MVSTKILMKFYFDFSVALQLRFLDIFSLWCLFFFKSNLVTVLSCEYDVDIWSLNAYK